MDLETTDKIAKLSLEAEKARREHKPTGSNEDAPLEERLDVLLALFDLLKAGDVYPLRPTEHSETIVASGKTPADRFVRIAISRFHTKPDGGAPQYYGIDTVITCDGMDITNESINRQALGAYQDRNEREIANIEETFQAAALLAGVDLAATVPSR